MTVTIGRRELLDALGGAVAWPLAARAQQPGKLPTIGFLGADATVWSSWTTAFVGRLRELGWIEGRTSRSSIAGRREDRRASPRSRPSLSDSRSTSLSQTETPSTQQGERLRPSPSSLH